MTAPGHLFLSHHPTDTRLALRLAADLKKAGVPVWMAPFDSSNPLGAEAAIESEQALANCAAILAVLSDAAGDEQAAQVRTAQSQNKPVLIAAIGPLPGWARELSTATPPDFHAWLDATAYQAAFAGLLQALHAASGVQVSEPPSPAVHYALDLVADLYPYPYVSPAVHAEEIAGKIDLSLDESVAILAEEDDEEEEEAEEGELDPTQNGHEAEEDDEEEADDPQAPAGRFEALPNAETALATRRSIVLLGPPGGGKTTTLGWLAVLAARRFVNDPAVQPLPLWADLSRWEKNTRPDKFFADVFPLDLRQWLAGGRLALYLDEFDKLDGRQVAALLDWLNKRIQPHHAAVACRAASYNGVLRFPQTALDMFDRVRVQKLARLALGDGAEEFVARVSAQVRAGEEATVLPLAAVPYLLNALLTLYRRNPREKVPASLAGILGAYAQAAWQGPNQPTLYPEAAEKLARLAAAMIDEEVLGGELDWTLNQMSGRRLFGGRGNADERAAVDGALAAGLLRLVNGDVRFSHELLHSYYAALSLQEQGVGEALETPNFDTAQQRRLPGKWDQAVMMLCQMSADPDALLGQIAGRDPYLAVNCILSGVPASERTRDDLRGIFIGKLQQGNWRELRAVVNALRRLDETKLVELMLEDVVYGNPYERRIAARVLGEVGHPAAVPVLVEALRDNEVMEAAGEALTRIGAPALDPLMDALLDEERWEVRDKAAKILRDIGDPLALPALMDGLYDETHEVRWSSAQAASNFGAEAVNDLLEVLHEGDALVEAEGDVCLAAASALVWIGNEAAFNGLFEALKDADPTRRAIVAEALGGAQNPRVVPPLVERLSDEAIPHWGEEDETVAEIAVLSLESIGTPEARRAVVEWRKRRGR